MIPEKHAMAGAVMAVVFALLGLAFIGMYDWRLGLGAFNLLMAKAFIDLLPQPRR